MSADARTRVLRDERRAGDSRHLQVTLQDDGALRFEGHDLGDGVAAIHGPDIREYEWTLEVAVDDVPALRARLGLAPGADLLDELVRVGAAAVDTAIRDVPHRVIWSRLGD